MRDDDYQGTWELVERQPPKPTSRKDGKPFKPPHEFIDISAFRRLLKILERPVDERLGDGKGE